MSQKYNIAIVGSRDYQNLLEVREFVAEVAKLCPEAVIVSGGARGVDTAAADAAMEVGLAVRILLPDWRKYGKIAGFLRNTKIVEACDYLAAFWDGVSRGTVDSINKARVAGKLVSCDEILAKLSKS